MVATCSSNSLLCFSKCARSASACASDLSTSPLCLEEASTVRPLAWPYCHFVVRQHALLAFGVQVLQHFSEHHCVARLSSHSAHGPTSSSPFLTSLALHPKNRSSTALRVSQAGATAPGAVPLLGIRQTVSGGTESAVAAGVTRAKTPGAVPRNEHLSAAQAPACADARGVTSRFVFNGSLTRCLGHLSLRSQQYH